MLDAVKELLAEPTLPFDEYYNQYICEIQDTLLDNEIWRLHVFDHIDIWHLPKLIEQTYSTLADDYSFQI